MIYPNHLDLPTPESIRDQVIPSRLATLESLLNFGCALHGVTPQSSQSARCLAAGVFSESPSGLVELILLSTSIAL